MNSPELSKRSTELAQHQAYLSTLAQVQQSITQARARAALSVNAELTGLYWRVGERIAQLQQSQGWGSAVVDQMARDLARAHPGIAGFSRTNLFAMRQLYLFFSQKFEFVPQPVGQMPWGHVRVLLGKVKEVDVALWYAQSHAEHGWSREMLSWQIDQQLHARIGAAPNNFESTLSADRSDLVTQTIKDPYVFDFLNLQATAVERDIENQLTQQITRFLLELGKGFAFLGRQYPIHVNDKDYFLDLLFYHTRLKCYVVVELKAGEFIPEHVGKMNFYLSAVDDQLRAADDQPSIGLILCKNKDRLDVEYALRDIQKPIGVSSYITKQIPIDVQSQLPSVEELEKELLSISAGSSGEQEAQK